MSARGILLEVNNLKKYFPVTRGIFGREIGQVKAVDGFALCLREGECMALVGESGCGKTTAGRTILRLIEPCDGEILFHHTRRIDGVSTPATVNITTASTAVLKKLRQEMQIIYQDPYSSLNGRMTVGSIVGEPLLVNHIEDKQARSERVRDLLKAVGALAARARLGGS